MDFDTILMLCTLLVFVLAMAVESALPSGRTMPHVRFWRLIGISGLVVTLICYAGFPMLMLPYLPHVAVADFSGWGLWAAIPTVILTTFFTYWSHRIQHRFDALWRLGHQLHHSVARVDIASAMIFHPVDVLVQVVMSVVAALLLNASYQAAGVAGVLGFGISLYQHWDVRTPHWTGWFIQRPEAHMFHHERGVHARNFGDMPVWDHLFGTYYGAEPEGVELGFRPERSRRVLAMIACIDVNKRQERAKI